MFYKNIRIFYYRNGDENVNENEDILLFVLNEASNKISNIEEVPTDVVCLRASEVSVPK